MAYNYSKEKLMKVGKEQFALVDECLGRKATGVNAPTKDNMSPMHWVNPPQRLPPPPPQGLWGYPYQPKESHDMDYCYEAAQIFGGSGLVGYPKRKPMHEAHFMSAIDCYEAAKIYGGMQLADYPKRKPMPVANY